MREYHSGMRPALTDGPVVLENVIFCEDCGLELCVGCDPKCPHSDRNIHFGDDPMEAYIDVNITTEPVEITSRGQRRTMMNKLGLEFRPKRFDLIEGAGVGRKYFT